MSVSLVDYNPVDLYSDPAGIFSIQCSLGLFFLLFLSGIGGHKLRFLQENCLVLMEKQSILSERHYSRSKVFFFCGGSTYGAYCQAFY